MEQDAAGIKKKKTIIRNIGIAYLLVILTFTFFSRTIYNFALPQVLYDMPVSGTLTHRVSAEGTVNAVDIQKVYAAADIKVLEVPVKAGSTVKKGDIIARIDTNNADIELKRKEFEILMLEAEIDNLKNGQDNINREILKIKTLEWEIKSHEFENMKESIPSDGLFTAQSDGTVKSIPISEGMQLSTGHILYELVPADSKFIVWFDVQPNKADILLEGDTVNITLNNQIRKNINGAVFSKNYLPLEGVYRFFCEIENTDGMLSDGLKVSVSALKGSPKYTCLVQNKSLHNVAGGSGYIYVLEKRDGFFGTEYYSVKRRVSILESDDTNSAVEGQIDKADFYIYHSTKAIDDNMRVKIEK